MKKQLLLILNGDEHELCADGSAAAWGRARESEVRVWVAGRRVNLLLALSPFCAPN